MKNLLPILQGPCRRTVHVAAGLLALLLVARTASAQIATFDFDTGDPAFTLYQGLPVDQTVNGATAHFRAVSGAFSVQTAVSLGRLNLSLFAAQFLAPANNDGSVLEIQFSEWVTDVTFPFATIQTRSIEKETPIRLTAYMNSAATAPVGMTNATGSYNAPPGNNTWPMGTLTFHSSVPFNLVRISVPTIVPPPPTGQARDFCLDTLTVQRAGGPACTITADSSPGDGGLIAGGGGYIGGTGGGAPTCDGSGGAGGGGGSSFGTVVNNGSGTTPGNSGSSLRGSAGNGGSGSSSTGNPGILIIQYPN